MNFMAILLQTLHRDPLEASGERQEKARRPDEPQDAEDKIEKMFESLLFDNES